jgi:hypothetical protein
MALGLVNAMRDDGVLKSTTGANEDTLKVRPPLVCQAEHVDLFNIAGLIGAAPVPGACRGGAIKPDAITL